MASGAKLFIHYSKCPCWFKFRTRKSHCKVCRSKLTYQRNFDQNSSVSWKNSFVNQFKIEFLILFTSCRKVLGKMPGWFLHKQISVFTTFQNFIQNSLEKDFCCKFPFSNSLKPPSPELPKSAKHDENFLSMLP